MADQQLGNQAGFVAVSIGNGTTNKTNMNGGVGAPDLALDLDNMDNIAAMKTRLAAVDAGFYTAARLNTLSYNDMMYAVRIADANNTIKQ